MLKANNETLLEKHSNFLSSKYREESESSDEPDPITKLESQLDNMRSLSVKGSEKFGLELNSCLKIPEHKRMLMTNHFFNDQNEGEPNKKEELIISQGFDISDNY